MDKLGKSTYFTTLDLASGFHQIEDNQKDNQKTAFSVDNGHYEYVRMPFGLKNAPSTFQRVTDDVLKDLQGRVCLVYMDDIIIFSTGLQEHIKGLKSEWRIDHLVNFTGDEKNVSKLYFFTNCIKNLGKYDWKGYTFATQIRNKKKYLFLSILYIRLSDLI